MNIKNIIKKFEEKYDGEGGFCHDLLASKSFLTNAIANALAECEPSKSESYTGYKTPYERQIFRNAQNMVLADYKEKRERFLGL